MDEKKKEGRRNSKKGNHQLLAAKKKLDEILVLVGGHAALREATAKLREDVLQAFVAEERKMPEVR
jgi:hypothetical protein